jgi:hypothetical protein
VSQNSSPDFITILLKKHRLFLACFGVTMLCLTGAYVIRIRTLPAEVKFTLFFPVTNSEDLGTFTRKCLFDPERLRLGVKQQTNNGSPNDAPVSIQQESAEIFKTALAAIQKTNASPAGTFALITLTPNELKETGDDLYRHFLENTAIPAVVCHAWIRSLAKIEKSLSDFSSKELLYFPDYYFFRKTLKARRTALQRTEKPAVVSGRNQGGAGIPVIPIGRLAVPAGTQLLSHKDQSALIDSALSEIDDLISYGGSFIAANGNILRQLNGIGLAGPLVKSTFNDALDKAASKEDWVFELIQKTKVEFNDTVERFVSESTNRPDITTNIRYTPKLRHILIIGTVAGILSVFLTLFIAAYQIRGTDP